MRGWWLIIQLGLQKELGVEIVWLHINLSAELDDVSKNYKLLGIPDEKSFCVKGIGFLLDVWLNESVE